MEILNSLNNLIQSTFRGTLGNKMELESIHLLWNLVLTGIVAPFVWFIVQLHTETKRLEILLNRTREEMNRDFVSKEDLKRDMERMMDSLDNINKKIDDFLLSNQK